MPSARQRNNRRPTRGSASFPSRPRKRGLPRSAKRLIFMLLVFILGFGAMASRLVMLQIVEAPAYARLASQQREREIIFPARRGTILDRAGQPLAISVDVFMIYTDHIHVEDQHTTAMKLAPLLDQTPVEIEQKLLS